MKTVVSFLGLLACLLAALPTASAAADRQTGDSVTVKAEYAYIPRKKGPQQKARALAMFGAKQKAAGVAMKYLVHRGLLPHFGDRQKEILCLAADRIEPVVEEERYTPETGEYVVRIRVTIDVRDFVQAEIFDQKLEKEEKSLSFRAEMEQQIAPQVLPGRELSRAYRYLRRKLWRIAVIYLDHLQEKYPDWGELYLAKAIGFFSLNRTGMMTEALKTGCLLNNQEACEDYRGLVHSPLQGTD